MATHRKPPPLSAAQLEVMNVVWDRGEAGVAEIWQELSKRRGGDAPVARNTVQTTLSRLAAKGWLRYRQDGNTFLYTAAQPRRRALGGLVSRLVDTAFAGSASSMVLSLIEDGRLSEEEARRIRDLIDQAAKKRQRGGK
jgi:BlaI family transcriptional regulator, penicillinase repressor